MNHLGAHSSYKRLKKAENTTVQPSFLYTHRQKKSYTHDTAVQFGPALQASNATQLSAHMMPERPANIRIVHEKSFGELSECELYSAMEQGNHFFTIVVRQFCSTLPVGKPAC